MRLVKTVILFFLVFYISQLLIVTPIKGNEIYSEGITTTPDLELQNDEPIRFELHTISSRGETPYFLAKTYGITVEDIYKYNPDIKRFNRGTIIRIPRFAATKAPVSPVVSKSEEHAPTEEATDNNNIIVDITSKPSNIFDEVSTTPCQPLPANEYLNKTFNIALFLPFFLETNYSMNRRFDIEDDISATVYQRAEIIGNDTIIEIGSNEDMFIGFYSRTEEYLQFYEGALLAVDSMQKRGMRIRLNVYDTQQNPDIVRRILSSYEFLNTDLIIGPVFPNEQRDVSAFSVNNQIAMISPLAAQTNDIINNPFFYQINPDRDYLFSKTAEMVTRDFSNCNFIVFRTGYYSSNLETGMVDLIRENLNGSNGVRFIDYNFRANGIAGLRSILSPDRENVIFIPSSDEGELSIGISNLNNLANEYPITLIGTNRYPQYESIQIEYFHNLKLTYVAPYWTDYEKNQTVKYVEKFKHNFFTEPNNFGQQGYDVTFYFLNALKNYGRDFRNCLPEMRVDLIQGNYRFEKISPSGGYMNQGVSVISYTRNYDVVRKRINAL